MVVVVPALAEGDGAGEPPTGRTEPGHAHVEALHGGALHVPGAVAVAVREVADQPMAGDADPDSEAHAPQHPTDATECEQQRRPRQLLPEPMPFEPTVERVVLDV